jgi:hypothetical protein
MCIYEAYSEEKRLSYTFLIQNVGNKEMFYHDCPKAGLAAVE